MKVSVFLQQTRLQANWATTAQVFCYGHSWEMWILQASEDLQYGW